jgi:SNF2 family DNA or RNA helicase
LVAPFTLSMSADDYLDMPDRINSVIELSLASKVQSAYDDFKDELLLQIDGQELDAQSAAVLANKLLQFCNGAIYTDEHKNFVELHSEKLDALEDLISDNPNENLLVAYNYKSDLERLTKRFPSAVVLDKNHETIDNWNQGKIKLLLAHPASAGHGLNLQHGGSVIVWFGLNWSLEYYQQFNGRLHRQGQQKPVRVIHLVVKDCIDERVVSVLTDKAATQQDLLNAVKNNHFS